MPAMIRPALPAGTVPPTSGAFYNPDTLARPAVPAEVDPAGPGKSQADDTDGGERA